MTPWPGVKPSISVRIWFSVCSRSSLLCRPPPLPLRARPIASSSSTKTIAGAGLVGLREQVADAAGAHADHHLDELRGRDEEERHVGLAGDGAGEQRLAGAGRPGQQHALRDRGAQRAEALRVAEEVHDLGELRLGLLDAGHVGERGALVGAVVALRARAAEARRAAGARAAHDPDEHADEQQRRPEADEQRLPERARGQQRARVDADVVVDQQLQEAVVLGEGGTDRLEVDGPAQLRARARRRGSGLGSRRAAT